MKMAWRIIIIFFLSFLPWLNITLWYPGWCRLRAYLKWHTLLYSQNTVCCDAWRFSVYFGLWWDLHSMRMHSMHDALGVLSDGISPPSVCWSVENYVCSMASSTPHPGMTMLFSSVILYIDNNCIKWRNITYISVILCCCRCPLPVMSQCKKFTYEMK